ncbi:MAG: hypothetical protein ACTSP3_15280 [Candidatus Heimdallarchaeaceae archaeon]
MTEKEYIELLKFIWKERTKKANLKIEIEIQKEKRRLIYKVKKKPVTTKGRKKLVKGERTVTVTTKGRKKLVKGERTVKQ